MGEVETALVLRMEATLTKFEKQMAKARSAGVRTATDLENRFGAANKKMSNSAQQSAEIIGREMERLRSKYDPVFAASRKYESAVEELNRAHKVGALDAKQYERALESLNTEYTLQQTAATRAAGAMGRLSGAMRGSGGGIQNVAYQVGDFAVQVGAGTSASMALGQQLPQLLGGFGVMGAVMGAVVAVGVPLVRTLLDTGDASKELEDQLKALESAVADYNAAIERAIIPTDELREKYGTATVAAQQFLAALVEINKVQALDALATSLETIVTKFGGLSDDLINVGSVLPLKEIEITAKSMAEQFEITAEQAEELAYGLRSLSEADGTAAQVSAARELLELMTATLGPVEDMPPAARLLAQELSNAGVAAAEVQAGIDRTNFGVQDLIAGLSTAATNLGALVTQAGLLGDNMYRAAGAAWNFLAARAREKMAYERSVGGGRGSDPRLHGGSFADVQANDLRAQLEHSELAFEEERRKATKKAARAKSRGGKSRREKDSLIEIGQRELESLERQIEMIGKSDAKVAELTARYKLLDEAKKRGINLDAKQAGSSQTVREQIDEQAAAIGRLTEKAEQYKEQAAFMDDLNQELKDGFIDAIIEGENFGDVLKSIAKQLAKAALQAALFNEGPFSRGGGGGGLLGNIFGAIFKRRAVGGSAEAGRPYLVNENTPNSEVFVPSSNGAVLNVSQAQSALRGMGSSSSGRGPAEVAVRVIGGDLVLTDSGQIAARIQVSAAQARAGATSDVKANWGAFQQRYSVDGAL
tara:strand:- start:35503 stop:37788 length:2286 start_codon:yes stop_codon:yes gene_type:complete